MTLSASILIHPPSQVLPSYPWEPSPILHVKLTSLRTHRALLTARISLLSWNGLPLISEMKFPFPPTNASSTPPGPYFSSTAPVLSGYTAPVDWDAYFCWEGLSVPERGVYRVRFTVEMPFINDEGRVLTDKTGITSTVDSRFIVVGVERGLSLGYPCEFSSFQSLSLLFCSIVCFLLWKKKN